MIKEDQLESALRELIQQTDQALAEGSIYSAEFKQQLQKARKSLPGETENENSLYPSGGFHVLQQ